MRRAGTILTTLALAAGVVVSQTSPAASAPPPLTWVECGQDVTESIRLANSLDGCPDDGLVIKKGGITVDMNGHAIDSDGLGTFDDGIEIASTAGPGGKLNGVTVLNGIITDFDRGIRLDGSAVGGGLKDVTVRKVVIRDANMGVLGGSASGTFTDNVLSGIVNDGFNLDNTENGVVMLRNTFTAVDAGSGILIDGGNGHVVSRNTVIGSAHGFTFRDQKGGVISRNSAIGNTGNGITITDGSEGITVSRNIVRGNGGYGVFILQAKKHTLTKNTVTGGAAEGLYLTDSDDNLFSRNTITANNFDGAFADSDSTGNTFVKNRLHENGGSGLKVETSDVTVNSNIANYNGFLYGEANGDDPGIDVTAGSTSAGNKAQANDAPAQCATGIVCTPGAPLPPIQLITCTTDITGTTRVRNNIDCTAMDGPTVSGTGAIVDLGGHRFEGDDPTYVGIGIDATDVTVRNGVLAGFETGIFTQSNGSVIKDVIATGLGNEGVALVNMTGAKVSRVTATDSGNGITTSGVQDSTFDALALHNNDDDGFSAETSSGIRVGRSSAIGNGTNGFFLETTTASTITRSTAIDNDSGGIEVTFGSDDAVVTRNLARANDDGISVSESSGVTVSRNRAFSNDVYGIWLFVSESPVATRNTASANGGNGIEDFDSSGDGAVIKLNTANENGDTGIHTQEANTTLVRNTAHRNGFINDADGDDFGLGIEAPSGTTNAGNKATGNDDPNECEALDLNCFQPT